MASGFVVLCGNLFLQPQECQNYSRIGLQLLVYIYVGACISETTCSSDLVFTYCGVLLQLLNGTSFMQLMGSKQKKSAPMLQEANRTIPPKWPS